MSIFSPYLAVPTFARSIRKRNTRFIYKYPRKSLQNRSLNSQHPNGFRIIIEIVDQMHNIHQSISRCSGIKTTACTYKLCDFGTNRYCIYTVQPKTISAFKGVSPVSRLTLWLQDDGVSPFDISHLSSLVILDCNASQDRSETLTVQGIF